MICSICQRYKLARPPDQQTTHPESGTCRALFDCPDVLLTPTGPRSRVIVATHPATSTAAPVGVTRDQCVYELFFTALPQGAFTPADVLALSLHRGAYAPVLSEEDKEQDPDRWCSHTACGQELWQVVCQWMWNLRLELGHRLHPPLCVLPSLLQLTSSLLPHRFPTRLPTLPMGHRSGHELHRWGDLLAIAFSHSLMGRCAVLPGNLSMRHLRRPERDGSVRVVYAARIAHCRACLLRQQCLGYGTETKKPRRESAVLWPILGPPPPPEKQSVLAALKHCLSALLASSWRYLVAQRVGGLSPSGSTVSAP